ncbi:helix-turn-helix domain-containing protein [Micrococcus luteus]
MGAAHRRRTCLGDRERRSRPGHRRGVRAGPARRDRRRRPATGAARVHPSDRRAHPLHPHHDYTAADRGASAGSAGRHRARYPGPALGDGARRSLTAARGRSRPDRAHDARVHESAPTGVGADRRERAARLREAGWSNKQIARELDVHPSTVGRWFPRRPEAEVSESSGPQEAGTPPEHSEEEPS